MRCPRPCRARNATRFPSSVPITNASEGSPKGVFARTSRVSLSPFIEYTPPPPMIPMRTFSPANCFFALFLFFAIRPTVEFTGNLARDSANRNRLGLIVSIAFAQVRRAHHEIMRKEREPAIARNPRQPFLLVFERRQRIQVKSHNPRQRQMGRRRHQVSQKYVRLPAAFELYALHRRRMPRHGKNAYARHNFLLAFDKRPLLRFFDRRVIFQHKTRAVALRRLHRVLE